MFIFAAITVAPVVAQLLKHGLYIPWFERWIDTQKLKGDPGEGSRT